MITRPASTAHWASRDRPGARSSCRATATGNGTLADPYLYGLYQDNGNGRPGRRIAGSGDYDSGAGDDSLVLFRAPESADYYIATSGYYTRDTGSYTVSVTEIHEQRAD